MNTKSLEILFEDEDILCVNKPSGVVVHKTLDQSRLNILDQVEKKYPSKKVVLHHRLDEGTSGALLFSISSDGKKTLSKQFEERTLTKKYQAIVKGEIDVEKMRLECFLKENKIKKKRLMSVVKSGGKKAVLELTTIKKARGFTHVEVNLITGRRHQIRVQLASHGFPILGDNDYGDKEYNYKNGLKRLFLHASYLEIYNSKEELIKIESELPLEFKNLLDRGWIPSKNIYILFNKPYNVLCQFSGEGENLSDYNFPVGVYPLGRLDKDSEGLLILTNDKKKFEETLNPNYQKKKTYLVLVDGVPDKKSLSKLANGIKIKNYKTKKCIVKVIKNPKFLWDRDLPLSVKNHEKCWLEITITQGKNRQVRRMTAAIGHPTLRLVRVKFDNYELKNLLPGQWIKM